MIYPEKTIDLSAENWTFKKEGENTEYEARIPGCIHTDLFRNNLIPDPYFGLNEKEIQWIEKENWVYSCKFNPGVLPRKGQKVLLCFEGIDTYSEISLNGQPVLQTNNMFTPWSSEVEHLLVPGINTLEVILKSAYHEGLKKHSQLSYSLPANNDEGEVKVSPFTRKAPYMYGWDWGPRLLTAGIWKKVRLRFLPDAIISELSYRIIELEAERAVLEVFTDYTLYRQGHYELSLRVDGNTFEHIQLSNREGENTHQCQLLIKDPQFWWPAGHGGQYLYEIHAVLAAEGEKVDAAVTRAGLRTAELITHRDPGKDSFTIRINQKDIFIRGANIIPLEYFVSDIRDTHYEQLIENALVVNMNMLRAWGGGIYEADAFYNLCDEKGIMVWQDFMFACGMYPSDSEFLNNLDREFDHQIKRLRNHTSVVLWCGNNEILEGYHQWGWKEDLGENAGKAFESYRKVFYELIPSKLNTLDPTRPYWPSSPSAGFDKEPQLSAGDFHYWDLVKDIQPYTVYRENVGRFMSEYGFKSYPLIDSVKKFLEPRDWSLRSKAMEEHQGWVTGADLVEKNLEWFYPPAKSFPYLLYQSQLLQADAIGFAIESHRLKKPQCMGTLYWQFNDCWPSATWSGIDYYGNWKAMHYRLKTVYQPVLPLALIQKDQIDIHGVNDNPEDFKGSLFIQIMKFNGTLIFEKNVPVCLPENSNIQIVSISRDILTEENSAELILNLELKVADKVISFNQYFFETPRGLRLRKPHIETGFYEKYGKTLLTLHSDTLSYGVYLQFENCPGFFSDNFFHLLPGKKKTIIFAPESDEVRPENLRILTLFDTYEKSGIEEF